MAHKQQLSSSFLPENSRIVQPAFLEKHSNKKDLVRRLRKLCEVLHTDESIEAHSEEWPALDATADCLVSKFLHHKDKEVRLYTVTACMELFAIYVPDFPFDDDEILQVFRQTVRQLAGLAVCTDQQQPNFARYARILDLLAHVRIGVVLVELCKRQADTASDSEDDEKEAAAAAARNEEEDGPAQVLVELIHTLLHAVRNEHPPIIQEYIKLTIQACLEEYNPGQGMAVPVAILDELLLCIGQGPVVTVTNPAAAAAAAALGSKKGKHKKKSPVPAVIEQPNPSFAVAAAIIRSQLNRIATPIAALLNAVLSGDPHFICEQSSIHAEAEGSEDESCVYKIVYELHAVAPQILTTVIGTVSNGLESVSSQKREQVTVLLGKLFADGTTAANFYACYREWLGRHKDKSPSIRRVMVQACCNMLQTASAASTTTDHAEILTEADNVLRRIVTTDPDLDVRLEAIHEICNICYSGCLSVTAGLLQAAGSRVGSRHKQERRDAAIGLSQIHFKQFVSNKLQAILAAEDDCDLAVVLSVLHETCHLDQRRRGGSSRRSRSHASTDMDWHGDEDWMDADEEKYAWIPAKVFECVCFTDQSDPEMRSRVVQIVDEILLGSDLSSSSSKHLTSTARAVGLAMILNSLLKDGDNLLSDRGGSTNAFKFLQLFFEQRASLQKTVRRYIDARAAVRECKHGTEEELAAEANAMELLEAVASLTAPGSGSMADILESFHGARDKHIFRILATIANPAHSKTARARALDELPKRTKSLGDAVSNWVKNLARRCVMGDFINAEIINRCVVLAQDCFREGDVPACAALLSCVKTAADIFPAICGTSETFGTLTELFSECRSVTTVDMKKELKETGIVTALSSILSAAAPTRVVGDKELDTENTASEDLQSQLLKLCTRDGTPEQARNAVYTLARLLTPSEQEQSYESPSSDRGGTDAFSPLLNALTSPTRMTIASDRDESPKVVSVLSALAALTECAPRLFSSSGRGDKAIKFSLETILMGRSRSRDGDSDDDSSDEEEEESSTPSPSRKKRPRSAAKSTHVSPEATASLLEDENLSIACRRLCAAIEFLVSFIRSTLLHSQVKSASSDHGSLSPPSMEQIQQVFQLLAQMLHDKGLPPSNRDRKLCKTRQDRAALRQCTAVHLLRLCDSRLGLEKKFLSHSMWHTFSQVFLDEERVVREAVMEELALFLKGTGMYGTEGSPLPAKAPSLRFVSLVVLCTDGDHGVDHDAANGSAANVGKLSSLAKNAALQCVVDLRKVCDDTYNQCRALGKAAEKKFDTQYKMLVMPEYMVPYAFHLLSHRRETPSEGGTAAAGSADQDGASEDEDEGDRMTADDESQHRILRKRLKVLFEPLVQSLGDGADNISFLLRMAEILGKQYGPVDVAPGLSTIESSPIRLSPGFDSPSRPLVAKGSKRSQLLLAKLKTICVASREVLLSFVKKDVNLSPYPGTIQLPNSLFKKISGTPSVRLSQQSNESLAPSLPSSQETISMDQMQPARKSLIKQSPRSSQESLDSVSTTSPQKSPQKSRAQFSPELEVQQSSRSGRKSIDSLSATSPNESARKSRVHFSPELEFSDGIHRTRLPARQNEFGGLSPIAKSESPPSSGLASGPLSTSVETLGSTPPSALRSTMRSTAPDGFTDEESLESKSKSPIEASEDPMATESDAVDAFADDESGSRTTSETQSTQQSEPSSASLKKTRGRKRKSPVHETKPRKRGSKRGSAVPTQIKVNRPKSLPKASDIVSATKSKKRRGASQLDDLDFDFVADESENQPVRRNRKKATASKGRKTKKPAAAKGDANTEAQTVAASRPRRSRRL